VQTVITSNGKSICEIVCTGIVSDTFIVLQN